ncbi:MAG: hypothetical protein H8D23_07735, partial [Candidatus Brocadiales bacterium]|nr:hypothetical protein [Candidatus Brocadiales bacterium]
FALVGCGQVNYLIRLDPDGSGTFEETVLMRSMFVQQMKANMDKIDNKTRNWLEFLAFDELKSAERAEGMGEGVSYMSGEEVTNGEFEGRKVVYWFADINLLKPKIFSFKSEAESDGGVTFSFTRGDLSKLIISQPGGGREEMSGSVPDTEQEARQDEEKEPEQEFVQSEEVMEQQRVMFGGMKMAMCVEVQGLIEETNATYREESRITLMEVDMDKLLKDPEQHRKFNPKGSEENRDVREFLKSIPGSKVDMNKELMVKFR